MAGSRRKAGALALAACAMLAAGAAEPASAQAVAIVNGTVHTMAGPPIEKGTVLIRDGRIAAVGRDVPIPADAEVVNAAGKIVTPGLFDSSSQLGLVEIGAVPGTRGTASGDDRVTAAFNVVENINPTTSLIPVTRVEGITRAVARPSMGESLIAGQGVLLRLLGDDALDMVTRNPAAMFVSLDEEAAEDEGGTRANALLRFREALADARHYAANRRAFESGQVREYSLSRLDLEALVPVVRGELPVAINVQRASDILSVLRLAEEYGLDLILTGAAEGWQVADRIVAAGVPVIINPMTNIPGFDNLGATLTNAARLHEAGVTLAFGSFSAHNARNLKQAAGNAVAYGLAWEDALRAVTTTPAGIWGVADTYGTLQPGMVGDVVIWSGDPFELLTSAEAVFIDGRRVPAETRQERLFERYRTLDGAYPPSYDSTRKENP